MRKPFTVETLKQSGLIAYEVVSGSRMYGTNLPESDEDVRGVFCLPSRDMLCIGACSPQQEVSSEREDFKYFELKKFFDLAMECNPNVIELFWPPKECVRIMSPVMELLIANRNLFITKKAVMSHVGYANAQIGKATGQNKMVMNSAPEKKPVKEDFCWVIPDTAIGPDAINPYRPVPLSYALILGFGRQEGRSSIDLSKFHVASLERVTNVYRLYDYRDSVACKGVFRGDDFLVCESIPLEDEFRCIGLLIYDRPAFEKAVKDWSKYWTWRKERNESRWKDTDGKKFLYDRKNLMHCFRLLMSGINIIKNGEPIVRFHGDQLKLLMEIRTGDMEYDGLVSKANEMIAEMKAGADESKIPSHPDAEKADTLYKEARELADKNLGSSGSAP